MASKVEEARISVQKHRAMCEAMAPLDSGALLVSQMRFDAALDALIAAVRAEEREAVLREKGYNVIRISGEVGHDA